MVRSFQAASPPTTLYLVLVAPLLNQVNRKAKLQRRGRAHKVTAIDSESIFGTLFLKLRFFAGILLSANILLKGILPISEIMCESFGIRTRGFVRKLTAGF